MLKYYNVLLFIELSPIIVSNHPTNKNIEIVKVFFLPYLKHKLSNRQSFFPDSVVTDKKMKDIASTDENKKMY